MFHKIFRRVPLASFPSLRRITIWLPMPPDITPRSGTLLIMAFSLLTTIMLSSCTPSDQKSEPQAANYRQVEKLLDSGKTDEAISLLKQLASDQPTDWEAYNLLATIAIAQSRLDDADQLLQTAMNIDPTQARIWNNLGILEIKRGNTKTALTNFLVAEKNDPELTEALFNIATILQANKNFTKADEYYTRVITKQPEHLEAHYKRAANRLGMQNYDGAVDDYMKVLELRPTLVSARADLGFAYIEMNKVLEAEIQFKQAVHDNPALARSWYGLGLAQHRLEAYQDAVLALTKAVELAPQEGEYLIDLSLSMLGAQGTDSFAAVDQKIQQALQIAPNQGRVVYMAAVMYDDMNRPTEAIPLYERAIALDYQTARVSLYLGQNYAKTGDKSRARKVFQTLVEKFPPGSPIHDAARSSLQQIKHP